jgi:hypothetical protein
MGAVPYEPDRSRRLPQSRSCRLVVSGTGYPGGVTFARGSRARLTRYDLGRFAGGGLLDRVGRAVCSAGCLSRKELFEAWEVARRVRRVRRGGRVIDAAGGHGMLAHLMLLLDDTSPEAVVVDPAVPPSSDALHAALVRDWPRLAGRVSFLERDLSQFAFCSGDVIVSSHACGALTDRILDAAIAARAFVAVLPCCHDLAACDRGGLDGWMDGALAIDAVRAMKLAQHGYRVRTQVIPPDITPRNRLLLGEAED